jgi:hypothetical protein
MRNVSIDPMANHSFAAVGRRRSQALSLAVLTFVVSAALIYALPIDRLGDRVRWDEKMFHFPAVQHFAQGGSASDYSSATTPGFHMVMGWLLASGHASLSELRLVGALITAVLVWMVARLWSDVARPDDAWLALPLATSIYVFPAGVWLVPDNLAWISVLGVLTVALQPSLTWSHVLWMSALSVLAVWVRQSNLWVIGVPALALLLDLIDRVRRGENPWQMRLAQIGVLVVPAVACLIYYALLWKGLTPPRFQTRHQALNPVAPAWLLVQFFVTAVWVVPLLQWGRRSWMDDATRRSTVIGACIGLLCAALPVSDFAPDSGRSTGLWAAVKVLPLIAHRSVFVLLGATLGGALLGWMLSPLSWQRRCLVLLAVIGFGLSMAANKFAYDKYYFAFAVMLVPLIVMGWPRQPAPGPVAAYRYLGVLGISAMNLVIVAEKLF